MTNIDTFELHFGQLDDARQSAKITYPLFDILLATLCAVITGAEGWKDIKESQMVTLIGFKNMVPVI